MEKKNDNKNYGDAKIKFLVVLAIPTLIFISSFIITLFIT